jgi:hypothetical protein
MTSVATPLEKIRSVPPLRTRTSARSVTTACQNKRIGQATTQNMPHLLYNPFAPSNSAPGDYDQYDTRLITTNTTRD